MREIRVLIFNPPTGWDEDDWDDVKHDVDAAMNKSLSGGDYTVTVWEVD